MSNMNAAIFASFGDPAKVVSVEQAARPEPGEGEILLKMVMSPIHNHDLLTIRGAYGVKPSLPTIGGTEAVAIVAGLGSNVTGIKVGDRVALAGIEHSWAEYFVAPAVLAVPVPDTIDDPTAAQVLGMPMGSVLALNQFDANASDWIIVNAANGAVGKVVAAAGRARGLNIALLVRREQAAEDLKALGFDHAFVTSRDDWRETLKAAIGTGRVAGAIDNLGGEATGDLARFVSKNGLVLVFGSMSGEPSQIDVADLIYKQIAVRGYWSLVEFGKQSPEQLGELVAEVFNLVTGGQLVLTVDRILPLSQSAEAMAASAKSRDGKVLIAA